MRILQVFIAAGALSALLAPASAQEPQPRVISGTITAVNGSLVTIQRSNGTVVVNDQPALDNHMTGNVAVGRQVVARGYWQDGTFFATSFADANVYGYAGMNEQGTGLMDRLRGDVRGTITAVNGHLVTLRGSDGNTIVINTQPALNRRLTGNVSVGRDVIADGYWQGGTFYATTIADANSANAEDENAPDFGAFDRIPDSLSGTITAVSGSTVTLQQSTRSIDVNDQPALNHKMTGNVAVGRQVIANGYWLHGTFYVTSFADATP
jgi:frataxin-like iron-binding protein CyaY